MATAIKAIPTLKGREARNFLRHANAAEHAYGEVAERGEHPFCKMAHAILSRAGMSR